jgi:probable HAF family extracellular repeat protein
MKDLGTLGWYTSASAVNDDGQVVGWSYIPEDYRHAFITGPDGMDMRDLGTLGGESLASGINDAGQVVGSSELSILGNDWHAFITGPDGKGMVDFNSLADLPPGVVFTHAADINNSGQVVVSGIPEPQSYIMLLAGLGLIGFMAYRKKAVQLGLRCDCACTVSICTGLEFEIVAARDSNGW